ncbi:hypothetical protein DP939_25210 [Spongiactinospora rosea]|uniref:Uncharacterized protein n=1 Tax=Spongiactinospora rosea TaxID=2248750 RepID=A0A366LV67_9ACTN|nr:hypothetical protein DP939_25210 [Spongiactinospora rosea]
MLLSGANIIDAGFGRLTMEFLQAEAGTCCAVHGLPTGEATPIAREAAFHLACALGTPPRDPDDPLTDAAIDILSGYPYAAQVWLMRAAVRRLPPLRDHWPACLPPRYHRFRRYRPGDARQ